MKRTYFPTLWERVCFNLPSLWAMVKRFVLRKRLPMRVRSIEETLQWMQETKCSVARYGDGEWRLLRGGNTGFQASTPSLRARLWEVVRHPHPNCLVCLSNIFNGLEHFRPADRRFWERSLRLQRAWLEQHFGGEYLYGDAMISRFYMEMKDKTSAPRVVAHWKALWEGRDLLIVEGEYSRFGMESDLFANATSVQRILCPPVDAWEVYDQILAATQRHAAGRLVLLCLGPTATVLAYDLTKAGIRAIDCGHFELEYRWMLMGAEEVVKLPNRWMNEQGGYYEDTGLTFPEGEVLEVIAAD